MRVKKRGAAAEGRRLLLCDLQNCYFVDYFTFFCTICIFFVFFDGLLHFLSIFFCMFITFYRIAYLLYFYIFITILQKSIKPGVIRSYPTLGYIYTIYVCSKIIPNRIKQNTKNNSRYYEECKFPCNTFNISYDGEGKGNEERGKYIAT